MTTADAESRNWPAFNPERRDPAVLLAYPKNARTHSPEQVDQIVRSFEEFGWTMPCLIDEAETILAGHGRVLGALKKNYPEVPVVIARGWTEDQKRAYVMADNQLALNAGWDENLLRAEFAGLQASGFDTSVLGFSGEFLADLFSVPVGLTDPEEVPAARPSPAARPGDVWVMGTHRIICGDCTDPAVVAALLGAERPHLMVTDPPYGVNYDPSWRASAGMGSVGTARGLVMNDHRADWREAWALFPGVVAYVWHGGLHGRVVWESLEACKFEIRAQIIWVKNRAPLSRGHYHWQHEPALYAVRPGHDDRWQAEHEVAAYAVKGGNHAHWDGGRKQTTVWEIDHQKNETGHSTQKPIDAMKRPMENNSKAGDSIYEPFSGSGTSIIAGEMCGRRVFAAELDPVYVDMAVMRWQNFTGKTATLHGTDQPFGEIAELRDAERAAAA